MSNSSHTHPACCTYPPYAPLLWTSISSWLLCGNSLVCGCLSSWCISFSFFFVAQFYACPNNGITFPTRLLLIASPLHTSLHCGRLFLVGCCVSRCWLAAIQRQWSIFFCIVWIAAPNNGAVSPHTLSHPCASNQTFPLPLLPTTGWLLVMVAT